MTRLTFWLRSCILLAFVVSGFVSLAQSAQNAVESTARTSSPAARPRAKSAEESKAYQSAMASSDPLAAEKSAGEFALRFPESELRGLLYRRAMLLYDHAGNFDRTIATGEKALQLIPADPVILVTLASVLADYSASGDPDRGRHLDDSLAYSRQALQALGTAALRRKSSAQAVEAAKAELRSVAYSSIGVVYFDRQEFAKAEDNFTKSIEAYAVRPDPANYLRLAMAQELQGKTGEAMKSADRSLVLADPGSPFAERAAQFRQELAKKAGQPSPSETSPGAPAKPR